MYNRGTEGCRVFHLVVVIKNGVELVVPKGDSGKITNVVCIWIQW